MKLKDRVYNLEVDKSVMSRKQKQLWELVVDEKKTIGFWEYKNGVGINMHEFTPRELLVLILDHLGLEPRNVAKKNILQKKEKK
jgi:hypothetical protein